MELEKFYTNLKRFSDVIGVHSLLPEDFFLDKPLYIEGIRGHISLIEKYCNKGSLILDLGCGAGFLTMQLSTEGFSMKGIDINGENDEEVNSPFKERMGLQGNIWRHLEEEFNIDFAFFDGKNIPCGNDTFHAVVVYAVIEHVPSEVLDELLHEIKRVLKPGGYLFIFRTPRTMAIMEYIARILKMGSHKILLSDKEIKVKLSDNSFNILLSKQTDLLPANLPLSQKLYNFLSPILLAIDKILLKTPLRIFAHHMLVIAKKEVT